MTEQTFTLGWNMPGYMPEMEPYKIEGSDAAKRAMIDELLQHADQDTDPERANALALLAEDLNLADVSQGWNETVCSLAYWIEPTES